MSTPSRVGSLETIIQLLHIDALRLHEDALPLPTGAFVLFPDDAVTHWGAQGFTQLGYFELIRFYLSEVARRLGYENEGGPVERGPPFF